MDVRIAEIAERQHGHIAWRQLRALGLSPGAIKGRIASGKLVHVHDGVFAVAYVPATPEAGWMAATLTTEDSFLAFASAERAWGLGRGTSTFEVVVRPGSGGPVRIGDLLVCRSARLAGETTVRLGIPMTRAARTIVDMAPHRSPKRVDYMVREGLRTGVVTANELWRTLDRHRGARGITKVRAAAEAHAHLPLKGRNSDAEVVAVGILDQAGRPAPELNTWLEGEEADLSWPDRKLIIELDGGGFHLFPEEDARKDAIWRAAGWTVRRLPTDDVYHAPHRLLALAPPAERRGRASP